MSISSQEKAPDPLRESSWLCASIRARLAAKWCRLPASRLASVQVLALLAFAFILAASMQSADGASLTAVGKHRSSRERGCYYMLQHYRNGEQIKTDEPCLNCTCENSMLMCYLRVCPYVKPVGDKCIIERVPGECCPRITCTDVAPPADSFEQDTIEPETSTPNASPANVSQSGPSAQESATLTASSIFDVTFTNGTTSSANDAELALKSGACMLNGQVYPEGAQMPADASKSCEVCYCIRSSAACVMQDCALEVSGCAPIYTPGGCCPTRYNCSAENTLTTSRPKTLPGADTSQKRRKFWDLSPSRFTDMASEGISSLMGLSSSALSRGSAQPVAVPDFGRRGSPSPATPGAGCKAPNSTRVFADGERVPSKNKCEHCYCMRGELVCAVQECRPPCLGCVPIIDSQDQCCPKRYECAAPTQRVSTDNLIVEQQDPVDSATSGQRDPASASNVTSTPAVMSTIEGMLKDAVASVSTSTALPPPDASTSSELAEPTGSGEKRENSVMTTRQTKPPLRPISPKLSTTADEDVASEVVAKDDAPAKQTKPSDGSQVSNVDGFNLNGGEREQETSELGKAAGRVEAPEGSASTGQQDSNEIPNSSSGTSSTQAPPEMVSDEPASSVPPSQPEKTIIVTNVPASPPMDGMNLVSGDRKPRPLVVPSQIPGEGSCRYKGRVYQNGEEIKSDQPCAGLCMCINSVVYCDEIDCPDPPENAHNCERIIQQGVCCPKYVCPQEEPSTTTTTSTVDPLIEAKSDTTTLPDQPEHVSTSTNSESEMVSTEQPKEAASSTQSFSSDSSSGTTQASTSTQPESSTSTESSVEEAKKSSYAEPTSSPAETTTAPPAATSPQPQLLSTSISSNDSSIASTGRETSSLEGEKVGSFPIGPAQTEMATATSEPSSEKSSELPVGSKATSEQSVTTIISPPASLNEVAISSGPPAQEIPNAAPPNQTGEQSGSGGESGSEITTTPSPGIISTMISFVTSASPASQTEPTTPPVSFSEQFVSPSSERPTTNKQSEEPATVAKSEMASEGRDSAQTNDVTSPREEAAGSTTKGPSTNSSPKPASLSTALQSISSQTGAVSQSNPDQPDISSEVSSSTSQSAVTTTTPPAQTDSSSSASQVGIITSIPAGETSSSSLSPVEVGASSAPSDTQAAEKSSADISNPSPGQPQTSVAETFATTRDSSPAEPFATSTVPPSASQSSSVGSSASSSTEKIQEFSTATSEVSTSTSPSPLDSSSERPPDSVAVNSIETVGSSNAPMDLEEISVSPALNESQTERANDSGSTSAPAWPSSAPEESSTPANAELNTNASQATPAAPVVSPELRAEEPGAGGDTSKVASLGSSASPDSDPDITTSPISGNHAVSSSQSPEAPTTAVTLDVAPLSSSTQSPVTEQSPVLTTSVPLENEPQTLASGTGGSQPPTDSFTSTPDGSSSSAAPTAPELDTAQPSSTEKVADSSPTTEAPTSSTSKPEEVTQTSTTPQSGEASAAPVLTESRAEEPKMSAPAESFSREPNTDLGSSTSAATTTLEVTQPPSSVSPQDASASSVTSPPVIGSELSKSEQDPAQNVVAVSGEQSTSSNPVSTENKQEIGPTEAPVVPKSDGEASTEAANQAASGADTTNSPVPSNSTSTVGSSNLAAQDRTDDTAARTNEHSALNPSQTSTDSPTTFLTTIMDFMTGVTGSTGVDVTPSPPAEPIRTSSQPSSAPIDSSRQDSAPSALAPSTNAPEPTSAPSELASSSSVAPAEVKPETRMESTSSAADDKLASSTVSPEAQTAGSTVSDESNLVSTSTSLDHGAPASDSSTSTTEATQTASEGPVENEVFSKSEATTETPAAPVADVSTSAPETSSSFSEIAPTTSSPTEAPSSLETTKNEASSAGEPSSTSSPAREVADATQPGESPVNNVIETSAKSDAGQTLPVTASTSSTAPELESLSSGITEASASASEATSSPPVGSTSQEPTIREKPTGSASAEMEPETPAPVESSSASSVPPAEPTSERSSVSSSDSSSRESELSSSPASDVTESTTTAVASSVSPPVLGESRVEEPKMIDVAKSFSIDPATNLKTSPEPESASTTTQAVEETSTATTVAPRATESSQASSPSATLSTESSSEPAVRGQGSISTGTSEVEQPKMSDKDENVIDTSATSTASAPIDIASSSSFDRSGPSSVESTTSAPVETTSLQFSESSSTAAVDISSTSEATESSSMSPNTPETSSTLADLSVTAVPESRSERPSDASETNLIEGTGTASTVSSAAGSDQASDGREVASTSKVGPPLSAEAAPTSSEEPVREESSQAPSTTESRVEEAKSPVAFAPSTEAATVTEKSTTTTSSTTLQSALEMDSSSVSELPASSPNATFAAEPFTANPTGLANGVASSTAASSSAPVATSSNEKGLAAEELASSSTSGEQASATSSPLPGTDNLRSSIAPDSSTTTSTESIESTRASTEPSGTESPSSVASSRNEVDSISSPGGLFSTVTSYTTTTTSAPQNLEVSTITAKIEPSEPESHSSTAAPETYSNVTTMSPADEFITGVSTIKSAEFAPVNVTTIIPSIRGVASSVTIPWTDISNATASSTPSVPQTSEASSTQPEVKHDLAANGTSSAEGSGPTSSPAPPSSTESDYEEVTDEPGCEYEGKTYSSAQQIARAHPCDFCFCFRGDIICLQQTCPPPVPHCFETVIDGFCCPRYECPVHTVRSSPNSSGLTLTPYETHSRLHAHVHDSPSSNSTKPSNVRGCYVDNKLIPVGKVIESASGPCLECLCDPSGMMKCNPKECTPEDPLLQQINREVLQSGMSKSQQRRRR